uniref:hypothetical protein n=1 Tax=Bradyrhizobium pachyrhizi TaxID=280333 RepID=UPI001AEC6E54
GTNHFGPGGVIFEIYRADAREASRDDWRQDCYEGRAIRAGLKVSDQQFASIVRKSGSSISAITKDPKVMI